MKELSSAISDKEQEEVEHRDKPETTIKRGTVKNFQSAFLENQNQSSSGLSVAFVYCHIPISFQNQTLWKEYPLAALQTYSKKQQKKWTNHKEAYEWNCSIDWIVDLQQVGEVQITKDFMGLYDTVKDPGFKYAEPPTPQANAVMFDDTWHHSCRNQTMTI